MTKLDSEHQENRKLHRFMRWFNISDYSQPFVYIPLENFPHEKRMKEDEPFRLNTCDKVWKFTILSGFLLLLGSLAFYACEQGGLYEEELEYYHGAEEEFAKIPSTEKAREWLKYYTAIPHIAGSKEDYEQAKWTKERLLEFGIPKVEIQTYHPLLNYPTPGNRRVAVIEPVEKQFECSLQEAVVEEDETSRLYQNAIPPFHGYSANGNVTGKLVYVNYGRREDFDLLRQKGVDFTGTIALVQYGRNFRGLKVRAAELNGCAGVIVFSDPSDDGFSRGPTYPDGPWRPESGAQRGSVHYMSLYPGDPLTPGYAAHKGSRRLPMEKALSLPKIPSIPISYQDARPLLQSLNQFGFSDLPNWKGGLDMEYWTGPGDAVVNLVNNNTYKVTPIWNVIAQIPGSDEPEKAIVIGNHRDAWVFGAVDPNSGSSCFLEVARAFGKLLQNGWRPRRTIILASWDGEEYGMVGSTEYVEDKLKTLSESVVAYLNVDTGTSGPYLQISATPTLSQMMRNITKLIVDPRTGKTLHDAWKGDGFVNENVVSEDGVDGSGRTQPLVGTLGSGSDFVGFVDFVGTAAVNIAFRGDYGVYHSNYDSFHWMEKFGDPQFQYHLTMSVLWGVATLRLADSVILPFNYTEYAVELDYYVRQMERKVGNDVQFTTLHGAIDSVRKVADSIQKEITNANVDVEGADILWIQSMNNRLIKAEREFLDPKGIPSRPWYKHIVYAPGLWAGYGAATFPTMVEAIDSGADSNTLARIETDLAYRVKRVAIVLAGLNPTEIEKENDILAYPLDSIQ